MDKLQQEDELYSEKMLDQLINEIPQVIAYIFQNKIKEGDMISKKTKNPNTYFCSKEIPGVSIKDYMLYLIKHFRTPVASLVLSMIYVERLLNSLSNALKEYGNTNSYLLTSHNCHRIVLTSLIIAHKYSSDSFYSLKSISKVVGVSTEELKILESEFLTFTKYELYVSQDTYSKYLTSLEQFSQILKLKSLSTCPPPVPAAKEPEEIAEPADN